MFVKTRYADTVHAMMEFDDFLRSKNIDPEPFATAEPERYGQWKALFSQMHPYSFVAQKKFLINDTRRRFLLRKPTQQ